VTETDNILLHLRGNATTRGRKRTSEGEKRQGQQGQNKNDKLGKVGYIARTRGRGVGDTIQCYANEQGTKKMRGRKTEGKKRAQGETITESRLARNVLQ